MKNKFLSFGPCYVINLKERTDRRSYIENHFSVHGVSDYKIFEAYDAKEISQSFKMTKSQIGCSMSHLLVMKTWYESSVDSEYLVVMEDDICLDNSKYWDWDWQTMMSSIGFNFDVLHLSTWALDLSMPEELKPVKRMPDDLRLLTSCYVITRRGVEQVLLKTIGLNGEKSLDFNDLENIADHRLIYGNVDNYYVLPMFSPNNEFISDIDNSNEVTRLQKMAAEHTSWLWKYNTRSIEEILASYE